MTTCLVSRTPPMIRFSPFLCVIYLLHLSYFLSVALRYNSLAILRVPNQGWEATHGTIRRSRKTQH